MNAPIDISPGDLETVREILAKYVPEYKVLAFGSRVTWTARQYSDLDLALMTAEPLDILRMADLRETFAQSDLPFRVDIVDWADTSENFRKIIKKECAIVLDKSKEKPDEHNKWSTKRLGDCAILSRQTILPSNARDVPYIGLEHIEKDNLHLIKHGEASNVSSMKTRFHCKDILFGKLRPYFRKIIMPPFEGICSTDIWVIRSKQGIDQSFLFYCLASQPFIDFATRSSEGTRMPRAKWDYVSQYEIQLPPLPEQRVIAHVLGSLDDKIELNRRMSNTLEAIAQALFKSWFVDFDPVRAKMEGRWRRGESLPDLPADLWDLFPTQLMDSKLGQIPEGWKVSMFNNVAEQLREQENPMSSPNTLFSHFSIPAFDNGQSPKPEYGNDIKSIKLKVFPETVLLSKLNPEIERVWLVGTDIGKQSVCSTEFLVLHARSPFTQNYAYCLLRSPLFQKKTKALVTGTSKSHQRVQTDAVLSLEVIFPTESVVKAFDLIVSKLLNRVFSCRREIKAISTLRDMLLPRLISGELKMI